MDSVLESNGSSSSNNPTDAIIAGKVAQLTMIMGVAVAAAVPAEGRMDVGPGVMTFVAVVLVVVLVMVLTVASSTNSPISMKCCTKSGTITR